MSTAAGDYVIAGDPDLGDMYVAQCIIPGVHKGANPHLRVISVLRYPVQHTIFYPDIAMENPPIRPDQVCQLKVYRTATSAEIEAARKNGYEKTCARALSEILSGARSTASAGEVDILLAHSRGQYGTGRRSAISAKKR